MKPHTLTCAHTRAERRTHERATEQRTWVANLLRGLHPQTRMLVLMHLADGLTPAECSAALPEDPVTGQRMSPAECADRLGRVMPRLVALSARRAR